MQTDFDALIIGAGPAGSAAAILLANAGWSVALVEKQRFPRRKVCGECIAASNWPLLDALGVGAALAERAGPELRRMAFMHAGRTVVADLPAAVHPRHPWGRALGRETLDTLLIARAHAVGAKVFQPCAAQALDGRPGAHRIEVRMIETGARLTLTAPVAIAAHGSWEPLPAGRAEWRRGRRPHDLLAFKANFSAADLAPGLLPVLAFDGGYGGMVVADEALATLACCIRVDRLDALRRASPELRAGDAVEALLKRSCHGVDAALAGARREGPWLATGPLAPGIRLRRDDPLFRIGNAAAEAHPIIGEGISMALQSAWLLCSHLVPHGRALRRRGADGGADRDDGDLQRAVRVRYAAAWRRHFATRVHLAAGFANAAMRPTASGVFGACVARWPGLLTHGARWGGKVRPVQNEPIDPSAATSVPDMP